MDLSSALFWTEASQRSFVSSAHLIVLTVLNRLNFAATLLALSSSIVTFMLIAVLNFHCMSLRLPRLCCTCLSTEAHPYSVQTPHARVNQCLDSFIPYTCRLQDSLPLFVFPPSYNLDASKRGVSGHLSDCF